MSFPFLDAFAMQALTLRSARVHNCSYGRMPARQRSEMVVTGCKVVRSVRLPLRGDGRSPERNREHDQNDSLQTLVKISA